ncbi:uncharacterized protein K441DRAFT_569248 [Cenococcum geophilum 1.58]|uniref:uncharacterized protein n=1 Tax=Cenococcum geophilum 1.58 TaxID=794803 RepID=UPI00358FBD45|nr:hypothetical protein K441DRAFT_569248 [Cenococcum geophilum 1.58]
MAQPITTRSPYSEADILLALSAISRGQIQSEKRAAVIFNTFVKRTDSLITRFNRPYDRQRALCEDPMAIP